MQTGGKVYTVDCDPDALAICRRVTAPYADFIEYVQTDSLVFLQGWNPAERGHIDLLYLDSLDYVDHEESEERHLAEAEAALPVLAPASLVLIDDTFHDAEFVGADPPRFTGKGTRTIPFLLEKSYRLEWCAGGQVLLSRGADDHALGSEPAPRAPQPEERFERLVCQTALRDVPGHCEAISRLPFLATYLAAVDTRCPAGGKTLEIGTDTGYGPTWLARRGLAAEGLAWSDRMAERAACVANMLDADATFHAGDPFRLYLPDGPHYDVIHHQGLLQHYPAPWIVALLAQQVASADWVVFSVPSAYYPFEPEWDTERLLPLEAWRDLLAPFDVAVLRYYGDPRFGYREHILIVLRGQPVDETLLRRMRVSWEPYPEGISAIVHTKNEARHIAECLQTLSGWTDEIIVCDMVSTDETVAIARRYTNRILSHPPIANFDRARNASAMMAHYRWVFFLDADERVPPGLGPQIRSLAFKHGDEFEALQIPFRTQVAGRWLECLSPGYKAPPLLKNGRFFYGARPHSGPQVFGRVSRLPADDPSRALQHFSYDSLAHYLDKMNRYTDTEAANMFRDNRPYHWQEAVARLVEDFRTYYDGMGAGRDGPLGFTYAMFSGFYRFSQLAKLYEARSRAGALTPEENAVPPSAEAVFEYALAVARSSRDTSDAGGPPSSAADIPAPRFAQSNPSTLPSGASKSGSAPAQIVWSGPILSPSGYGEECRHFLLALEEAGVPVAAHHTPWGTREADLPAEERAQLEEMMQRPIEPGFIQVVHNFAAAFRRHPDARLVIGRTMYETDRLPADWVRACNTMDYIWVPSEFNRQTFAQAGVDPRKLVVMPGCMGEALDVIRTERSNDDRGSEQNSAKNEDVTTAIPSPELQSSSPEGVFTFLSVFDWYRHKGWDLLLRGFIEAFMGREDVRLVIKIGADDRPVREQAAPFVQEQLGRDLHAASRIQFLSGWLRPEELQRLYASADAYVMPSRGEGWGRPYMEAMACGLPTIGTNWSGNTAFMKAQNSYLLDYDLVPVPEAGWREVPMYRGHRWAEPRLDHLKEMLRRVVNEPAEAAEVGRLGREHVRQHFSREVVGRLLADELTRLTG